VDTERMVLGMVLLNDANWASVESLTADVFSVEKHRRIFSRMRDLAERGEHIDRVTLATELRQRGELESVDGLAYLVSLDDGLPYQTNFDSYVRILEETHARRQIVLRAYDIASGVTAKGASSAEALTALTRALEEVSPLIPGKGLPTVATLVDEIGASRLLGDGKQESFGTPWPKLDAVTGGLRPGELVIVGARPSSGKTVILTQISRHVAGAGKTVAVISVEMSREAILQRMIAADGTVPLHKLRGGFMNPDERKKAQAALAGLVETEGLMLGDGGSTLPRLRAALVKIASKRKIDLVAVDYLQLISGASGQKRVEQITEISRGLKQIAVDLNCCMLVASQLSRESAKEEREPRLDDLRDSGSIEQDADVVIFPFRLPNQPEEERFVREELIVAKNRNGRLGRAPVVFEKPFVRFSEVA
jgi:replicative DNA helicase